jgi:muramoyltetrapeptide carboxypeptidase
MGTRGEFLGSVAMGAMVAAVPPFPESIARPPKLSPGDQVGLIAPASPPDPSDIQLAIENVRGLGLTPVLGDYVHEQDGFLAGNDRHRAADFNRMARDPKIRAIVAIRGGYGTMRILESLDYEALRRDPKVVMGYSDITAILNAVTTRSGIVTFHGPVGAHGSSWKGPARSYIERMLFVAEPFGTLHIERPEPIVAGRARGRLAGGNLSLVSALVGTPYAIPAQGALLFFEETQEAPYRIDRMLAQIALAGDLQAAAGSMFGQCTQCTGDAPTQSASEVIVQQLRAAGRPAVAGGLVGHIPTQWVLPIGVQSELDADAGTLTVLEPAVAAGAAANSG